MPSFLDGYEEEAAPEGAASAPTYEEAPPQYTEELPPPEYATSYPPIEQVGPQEGQSFYAAAPETVQTGQQYATPFGMAPDPAAVQAAYEPQPEMVDTVKGPLPQGWTPPPSTTAVPDDKWSWIPDTIAQFQAGQGIKDKVGGTILDLQSRGTEHDADVQGQRMLDMARHGDPDYTMGGFSPSELVEHPENILRIPGSIVHRFEGGPGGMSGIDSAAQDPQAVIDSYETTGDISAPYREYQAEMGHTLESGGLLGAGKGMLVGAASDPLLPATIATTKGLSKVAALASPVGQEVGLARGVVAKTAKGAERVVEGAYDFTDPALRVVGKALPSPFGRSQQTQNTIAAESVGEAVEGGARARLSAQATGLAPALSLAPVATGTPGIAPPSPAVGTSSPSAASPQQGVGTPVGPPPAAAPTPSPSAAPRSRVPVNRTDPRDIFVTPRGIGSSVDLQWQDGSPLTVADFEKARPQMVNVHPDDFYATQKGLPASWWTRMKSAMTQSGYMYNDWPKYRRDTFGSLPQNAGKPEAGLRWVETTAERIRKFGDQEVRSLLDDYETDFAGREVIDPGLRSVHFGNRADAIREAIRASQYKGDVILSGTSRDMHIVTGKKASRSPLRGSVVVSQTRPTFGNADGAFLTSMEDGTVQPIRSASVQEIELVENSIAPNNVQDVLLSMLHDADAFMSRRELNDRVANGSVSPGRAAQLEQYISARATMYRTRATTGNQRMSPWSRKTTDVDAKRRYDDFVRAWKMRGGAPNPAEPAQLMDPSGNQGLLLTMGKQGAQNHYVNASTGQEWLHDPATNRWTDQSAQKIANWEQQTDRLSMRDLQNEFRMTLKRAGFSDIEVRIVKAITGTHVDADGTIREMTASGSFRPTENLIRISREYNKTGTFNAIPHEQLRTTFNHEFMHAVRQSGVLTTREWDTLVNAADEFSNPKVRNQQSFTDSKFGSDAYKAHYEDLPVPEDMLEEEAVADMFSYYLTGNKLKFDAEAKSILDKLWGFVESFIQKFNGSEAEQIMDDIVNGTMGARARGPRTESGMEVIAGSRNYMETWIDKYPNLAASEATRSGRVVLQSSNTHSWQRTEAPSGLQAADPIDKYDGLPIAEGFRYIMDQADAHHMIELDGKKQGIWRVTSDVMDQIGEYKTLSAKLSHNPSALSDAEQKLLARYERTYGTHIEGAVGELSDDQLVQATTAFVSEAWQKGLPGSNAARASGLGSEVRDLAKNIASFRRGVGLSNWAAFARQTLTQYFGNVGTFLITGDVRSTRHLVSPTNAKRIYQRLGGNERVLTDGQEMARAYGLGLNPMVWDDSKSIALNNVTATGALGKVADVLAPKALRRIVATPDVLSREAKFRGVFRPAIDRAKKSLPAESRKLAADFNMGKYSGELGPVVVKADRVIEDLIRGARKQKGFDGAYLEAGIRNAFDPEIKAGTVSRTALNNYANRVARNWNTSVNTANQQAARAVKDTFFSWDNTKIDDVAQNVFLYHYWSTRAAKLYGKEMAKKPWMTAQFVSLAKQMQTEAEQGDYPEWMNGFTRILNTPAGTALWMSPLDMISTAGQFAEWQYGSLEGQFGHDLTLLGKARGLVPFVWNPLIEYGLWMAGAFGGESARAPGNPLGVDRLTTLGANLLNLALFHGMLPEGMGTDASGNPVPFSPRPVSDALGALAAHFGRPVASPYGTPESSTTAALYDIIIDEADGQISAEEVAELTNDIYQRAEKGDVDERLIEAERRMTEIAWIGPEFQGLPEGLRPYVGAAMRFVSPPRMIANSETKFLLSHPEASTVLPGNPETMANRAPQETDFGLNSLKYGVYETPAARDIWTKRSDWYDGGNPELSALEEQWHDIGQGRVTSVTIGSEVVDTSEMTEAQRYDIATDWLDTQGYGESDLDELDAYRDTLEKENPDLAGFLEYEDHLKGYPGGKEAFVDRAVDTSPSFGRYMEQTGFQPGTADYYKAATRPEAYLALAGVRGGVFDPQQLPPPGDVPGVAGGTDTLAITRATETAADAPKSEKWTSFVSDIESDVANIYGAFDLLNRTYPGNGYTVGNFLDSGTYNAMKPVWEANGIYLPSTKDAKVAYEYFTWLQGNATAQDHSVEAFLESRDYPGKGLPEPEVPDPADAASLVGTTLTTGTARGDGGIPAQDRFGVPVRVSAPIELRTGPSPGNMIISYADPSQQVEMVYKDPGGEWVQIRDASGNIGWVPISYIKNAA